MKPLRVVMLLLGLVVLCAACSSQANVVTDTGQSTQDEDSGGLAAGPTFAGWSEFGAWQAPSKLNVDGVEITALRTMHECFSGECGSPMDYWSTTDVVVGLGATVSIETGESTELSTSTRQMTSDLRFTSGPSSGLATAESSLLFTEPGLYHVDVRVDLTNTPDDRSTRFRHFLWVQVVESGSPCLDSGSAVQMPITGVVDADGCPSNVGALDIVSLHPEFHCRPWPATLRVAGRQGSFVRHQFSDRAPTVVDAPSDLASTGGFIALGEILESSADNEAVFIRTVDGTVERWSVDTERVGCA